MQRLPDLAAAAATQAQPPAEPTQPPTATPTTPSPTPSQQVDADTVKRHLTAARDTLSQLTQLPAAAQLTGDARTQVSQLISNFNELITTNVDWRAAYSKLQANLTALVGDQRTDESPAPRPALPAAVGTSGTVTLDPAIRAKLIEFRSHLADFEKAAGGSGRLGRRNRTRRLRRSRVRRQPLPRTRRRARLRARRRRPQAVRPRHRHRRQRPAARPLRRARRARQEAERRCRRPPNSRPNHRRLAVIRRRLPRAIAPR